jgi:hypothetical protein
MAITVPAAGQPVSASTFGIPVANQLNGIAPTAWTNLTLQNGWTNASGQQAAQYRKIGDMVQLRGGIAGGTLNAIAFTLPVGFRPSITVRTPITGASGSMITIDAAGNCAVYGSDNSLLGFLVQFSVLA